MHLGTFLALAVQPGRINGRTRYERDAGVFAEGSSPLEVAGNLYVYLIPRQYLKKNRGLYRQELSRGPPLPAGSRFVDV